MYSINFEEYFNLVNWECIFWGIKEQLLEPNNAIMYANKIIENAPDSDVNEIIELLITDEADRDSILVLIEKMFSDKKDLERKKISALRTLRIILLLEIQKSITDNQKLLDKIEDIYADFDYPSDMEGFISYMPAQDNEYDVLNRSSQENQQRLINSFKVFMSEELKGISPVENA